MPNAVKAKLNRLRAAERTPKLKIRKGDRVLVLTGENRGDVGRVIEVNPRTMTARVEGIRMVKKHQKADRVGRKILEDGSIVRYAKTSGAVLDKQG